VTDILIPARFHSPEFQGQARAAGWEGRMIPVSWRPLTRTERIRNRVLRRGSPSDPINVPDESELSGVRILLHAWPMSEAELSVLVGLSPELRWIHTAYAGAEMAVRVVGDRPIVVTNAGAQNAATVSEHAVALLLALARRLPEHFVATREGRWTTPPAQTLDGSNVLVFGLGRIGSAAAAKLSCLGCRVIGVRDRVELGGPEGLAEVIGPDEALARLEEADFVLLALPSTPRTDNLVDDAFLRAMRPGASIVNVGRAETIVDGALAAALIGGHLRAACLDVTRNRPLSDHSPLRGVPNLWLTHYTAYQRAEGDHLRASQQTFLDNLKRYVRDVPLENQVDLERGY
jgi:phosphoglycerate dehydrogenase-like enzyme